ncbi:UrcA family protein [Terricaulis sp.]|uniref:UrcA family protein n=1 Tax=Terricaulis sp. TaxID=2768686 RepID=UPI003784F160
MARLITTLAASVALAATAFTVQAFAQDPQSRVVAYGDLDLNSRQGADTLVRRIEQASDQVCDQRSGPRTIIQDQISDVCSIETEEQAVADVAHPNVSASYYGYRPQVIVGEDEYYPEKKGY